MVKTDKAGLKYWDENWSNTQIPAMFDHTNDSLDNYVNQKLHELFKTIIGERKNIDILEIGCANSIWPVYFHKYFDANVYGLDYSEIGCKRSRDILNHYNIPATILCADLFSPPTSLLKKFDLVVSFGVIEHFINTADCLKSCAAFVKPEGLLFTLIPNMYGLTGFLQKTVDKDIYDIHVPLSKANMISAHESVNQKIEFCNYFLSLNLGVVSSGKFSNHSLNKYFRHFLSVPSKTAWILEKYGIPLPVNKFSSPYIISLAMPKR